MRELVPADAEAIGEWVGAARTFTRFGVMDKLVVKPWEMVAMFPYLGLMNKWGKVTLGEVGVRFRDPFPRRAIGMIQYDFANILAVVALMFLSGCATRNFGWSAGGSIDFGRALAGRYMALPRLADAGRGDRCRHAPDHRALYRQPPRLTGVARARPGHVGRAIGQGVEQDAARPVRFLHGRAVGRGHWAAQRRRDGAAGQCRPMQERRAALLHHSGFSQLDAGQTTKDL
jgi:hypothetical protein